MTVPKPFTVIAIRYFTHDEPKLFVHHVNAVNRPAAKTTVLDMYQSDGPDTFRILACEQGNLAVDVDPESDSTQFTVDLTFPLPESIVPALHELDKQVNNLFTDFNDPDSSSYPNRPEITGKFIILVDDADVPKVEAWCKEHNVRIIDKGK